MADQEKKRGLSLFAIQTASYLLIILVVAATFGYFLVQTAKKNLEGEIGRKLQDIARIVVKNTPVERLSLIKVGDDQARMVLRLKEKIADITEATGVRRIFVFRPDQTSLLDSRPEVTIGGAYRLDRFHSDFTTKLQQGEAVNTGSYRDDNALYISAYAPVLDDQGRLFAIVGVDAGTREIEVIEQMNARLLIIAGAGAVLAIVLSLFLARRLSRPIQAMAKTAAKVGAGSYDARVPVPSQVELATLARSFNDMARQVQQRDKRLKEMAATIAHEIRNPLNSIKLLVSLLDEELADQKVTSQREKVDTLHYEIGKLSRLLTEFLTYSRPLLLAQEPISPVELAQSAIAMSQAAAVKGEVKVLFKSGNDLPSLTVDRQKMEQVLLDILLNGIQAASPGGGVSFTLRHEEEEKLVDFIVEDDGPGVPPEAMTHMFEPFFTTKQAGSGLGLANARKIVDEHRGRITVSNREPGGARFIVRIPVTIDPEDKE